MFTVLDPEAPGPPAAAAEAAAAAPSPSSQRSTSALLRASLVRVGPEAAAVAEAVAAVKARLEQLPGVAFVQPNYVYTALAAQDAEGVRGLPSVGPLHSQPGGGSGRRLLQPKTAHLNGRCGAKANARCGSDQCCSSTSRCSSTLAACGPGCQLDWGRCIPRLPREALKPGEASLGGMARIQASSTQGGAMVPAWPPADGAGPNVTVAIMDTGIASHPDLNIVGGRNFLNESLPDDWADRHGHGTHVAGIAGARNNDKGVWGVLPGVRLFAGKVLKDDGKGSSVDVARGVQWVAQFGPGLGVDVINLSIGGSDGATDALVCAAVDAAAARGMVVVSAAGNSASDMRASCPANCAGSLAVTAVDSAPGATKGRATPGDFSNWLPLKAPVADRQRTLAAPGVSIRSTGLGASFLVLSGTSAACPHAAGVAARCFASGDCKLGDGLANMARVFRSAMEKHDQDPAYRWTRRDATWGSGAARRYYGPLLWADYW